MDLFVAGSETTSTTLQWMIIYMILNPKIQKRCHQEILEVNLLYFHYKHYRGWTIVYIYTFELTKKQANILDSGFIWYVFIKYTMQLMK